MRNVFRLCAVMLIVGMVSSVYAQDQQRRQGRFMRGGNLGIVVNSLLLLQGDQAQKVEAAYQSASESAREGMTGQNFQDMSQEERTQRFQEMQKKTRTAFLDQLKGIVSEEQMKTVEPFVNSNKNFYRPELEALLSLDLKDNQQTELKSAVLAYAKKIQEHGSEGLGMRQDAENAELQAASTAFQDDVKKVLDDEQEQKWQAKVQEIRDARSQQGQGRRGSN